MTARHTRALMGRRDHSRPGAEAIAFCFIGTHAVIVYRNRNGFHAKLT